jgi:hypothetical protein
MDRQKLCMMTQDKIADRPTYKLSILPMHVNLRRMRR